MYHMHFFDVLFKGSKMYSKWVDCGAFGFFFVKVVVLVGSKVVLVVGFCGTFRGFSGNVVVLVG